MAARRLRVVFTRSAWGDLEEIVAYWSRRGEPEARRTVCARSPGRSDPPAQRPRHCPPGPPLAAHRLPRGARTPGLQTFVPHPLLKKRSRGRCGSPALLAQPPGRAFSGIAPTFEGAFAPLQAVQLSPNCVPANDLPLTLPAIAQGLP